MGMRPVMNEARPAVQLACPYQLVKTAPSFANLSTLGVGCPSVMPPPEYGPKSFQPVSSVMSTTILGRCELLACAGAGTAPIVTIEVATISDPSAVLRKLAPSSIVLLFI